MTEPHPRGARRLRRIRTVARALAITAVAAIVLTMAAGIVAMALQVPGDNPDELWTHVISTTAAIAAPIFILAVAALIAVYITASIYRSRDTAPKGADLS